MRMLKTQIIAGLIYRYPLGTLVIPGLPSGQAAQKNKPVSRTTHSCRFLDWEIS